MSITMFLGASEVAGALGLAFGVFTQWAAAGLIIIMFGVICGKVVKWKTGFWVEKASGWRYGSMFVVMNLTILCTGGGHIALLPMPSQLVRGHQQKWTNASSSKLQER
jgi:uncharacterized membrane protein YphA (DoxX/SURF4 family)